MKKWKLLISLTAVTAMLTACGHTHEFTEADCTTPKTCATCNATEGEALGHTWVDADCVTSKTCSVCEATEGEALGHTWVDADCVTPKTCSVCNATEGEALGHTWVDADCVTPKTCSVCNATEGEPLGHTWVEADCTTPKTCSACGTTEGEPLGHSWTEATCTAPKTCSACGTTEGETLPHTLTEANYQDAPLCTVCGSQVGEPLTPRFVEKGLETIVLPLTAPGEWSYTGPMEMYCDKANDEMSAEVKAAAYPVDSFQLSLPGQSAETTFCELFKIEPLEGYSVYCIETDTVTTDPKAGVAGRYAPTVVEDYYTTELHDITYNVVDSIFLQGDDYYMSYNTIDHHGEEKPCYLISVKIWSKWNGTSAGIKTYSYYYQPSDYAGSVDGYLHTETWKQPWEDGQYIYDLADEKSVLFRLDPTA